MIDRRLPLILLLALILAPLGLIAQPKLALEIEASRPNSYFFYDEKTGLITATNGVIVRYGRATLQADAGSVNRETGEVLAKGSVFIERDGQLWRGENVRYNFFSKEMASDDFRTGHPPVFAAGQGLTGDSSNHVYSATNAVITTDDIRNPFYKIRARSMTVIPGEKIEARNAVLYLGEVPVFYLPVYSRSLERHPGNFELTPGFRSLFGPFLLGTYNYAVSDGVDFAMHFDYRQRRGFGAGPDLEWQNSSIGDGHLWTYFARDENAGLTTTNHVPMRDNRFRVEFENKVDLATNLTLTLVARQQSDSLFIRDFFESQYRVNPHPSSFLELNQAWDNWDLNLMVQPRINDFYQTVERLPDLRVSGFRQQLGTSPIYYESESDFAYLRFQPAHPAVTNYSGVRADTYHQLVLPSTFFGWLNFTPRVGGRFSYYGEVDNSGAPSREQTRGVFNTGAELSFKSSRTWNSATNKLFDVNGLRHIFEPSINYVFVPSPNVLPAQLPQFDSELSSLRLLPIEYPDYNAIDSIDSQNVIRLSLRNKLQTRRADGLNSLVNWALYTDWRLKPRTGQSTFADFHSDLDFRPRQWLIFNSLSRFDSTSGSAREAVNGITMIPGERWSVSLGHRYLREDPLAGPDSGNNTIYSKIYLKLNENWAFRVSHHFEARDGRLEEQYYTVYRDLRSWTAALTFRLRNDSLGRNDFTVALSLSLKAFPRYKVGRDVNEPSYLIGS